MTEDALEGVLRDAQRIGLLGRDPVRRHIEHASAWADALVPDRFLDLGSGAGVPGLVLAWIWPEVEGVLLDGQVKRAAWLRAAVARLGLHHRITVVEGRAEELAHGPGLREAFPLVVARGFGPPATTAEIGSGFVTTGGSLTVSEPPQPDPDRWPAAELSTLGLEIFSEVVQSGGRFVILRKHSPLDEHLPRQRGLPLRNPLW